MTRKLNLDTQTHIQTTRKKKKKISRSSQADEHARWGLALSWRKSGTGGESLGLTVTQTEVFWPPGASFMDPEIAKGAVSV